MNNKHTHAHTTTQPLPASLTSHSHQRPAHTPAANNERPPCTSRQHTSSREETMAGLIIVVRRLHCCQSILVVDHDRAASTSALHIPHLWAGEAEGGGRGRRQRGRQSGTCGRTNKAGSRRATALCPGTAPPSRPSPEPQAAAPPPAIASSRHPPWFPPTHPPLASTCLLGKFAGGGGGGVGPPVNQHDVSLSRVSSQPQINGRGGALQWPGGQGRACIRRKLQKGV